MAGARGGVPRDGHDLIRGSDRPCLLERVGEAAVVQIYADPFNALSPRERLLAYHYYRAALAGRDIYFDQRYGHSLEMREVLEEILTHPSTVDPGALANIEQYTKLFWLNCGPHNNLTARKFVLECTRDGLLRAARRAAESGARLPLRNGETIDDLIDRLAPCFFDPDFEASVTNKAPGSGRDILASSANNLYQEVRMADLEGFEENYPLNSRLVRRDGHLVEEVYRVGGRYGEAIARIVQHLEAAMLVAPDPTCEALRALVTFYRTGVERDRRKYDVAWLKDRGARVDTINGFVEVYLDARGRKGSWEALVFYVNDEKTAAIRTLAQHAQWFEDRMPCDPMYRKEGVTGISANAVDVVVETGDSGPLTPIGINLPNDERIREQHGSKSVSLANVMEAYDRATQPSVWNEFSWTGEEAKRAAAWSSHAAELTTNLHEVIGHASGQIDQRLGVAPQAALKEYFSTIEEARADLVALYFLPDPVLADLGLVPAEHHADIVRAEYESYSRNVLLQLRRVRVGTQIEEDHMRNRQLIVRWLMENTGAVRERRRDGKTFYVVVDAEAFRVGVGWLLGDVQRIKSQGDYAAAQELVETYAIHFEGALRDEVVARVERVDLPSYTGFVMPRLEPVIDQSGKIVDASLSYPLDLTAQMLEYSGKADERRTSDDQRRMATG